MNAAGAADATKYFKPGLAIPYHWGSSVGTLADAQLFARNAACNAKVMTKGETISSDDWNKDFSIAAYWKLDEASGTVARDSNGSNHGDPQRRTRLEACGRQDRRRLELDGVDDYFSTPFVLNPSAGAFSIFAWVKGGAPGHVILSQEKGANWLVADAAGRHVGHRTQELRAYREDVEVHRNHHGWRMAPRRPCLGWHQQDSLRG